MDPLFVFDLPTLKASLRLSTTTPDTTQMLSDAIAKARATFYTRLGQDRVNAVLAMAVSDAPATDDELTRLMASMCEVSIVRQNLIRIMPTMFVEGNSANAVWNDDSIARTNTQQMIQVEIDRLQTDIENFMLRLEVGKGQDITSSSRTFDGTPDPCPHVANPVGQSSFRGNSIFL